jgi:hypothetical protein
MFVIFAMLFFHTVNLDGLPVGIYSDESSIGINAASIAVNGTDEHGNSFPIYFKAFGEYKNPLYIYVCGLLFKVFGVSSQVLRATSFLFFALGLLPCLLLIRKIFPNNRVVLLFAALNFGFLPVLFVLSRISFEVISQFTLTAWMLFFTWQIIERPVNDKTRYLQALILGFLVGLSVYSYSTARLLSALYCVSLAIVFCNRRDFWVLPVIALSCLVALIAYGYFAIENSAALTTRFKELSFIDDDISVLEKSIRFVGNYCKYFSLNFLVLKGDENLRHAIGYAGEVFFSTFILAAIGIFSFSKINYAQRIFLRLLLINLAVAPVAAALTNGSAHALRGLLGPVYMAYIACFGFYFLKQRMPGISAGLTRGILCVITAEVVCFLFAYFVIYPGRSLQATEDFDSFSRLQEAVHRAPDKIYFVGAAYANLRFFIETIDNPHSIPFEIKGGEVEPKSNECVVYHDYNEIEERLGTPVYEKTSVYKANWLQKMLGVDDVPHGVRLRCY